MHMNHTDLAQLERKVDYLIRYLGIDPAHVATGSLQAGAPSGRPAGDLDDDVPPMPMGC